MTTGNCDEGAECVGCTLKNETLTKDKGDGGCSCVVKYEGVLVFLGSLALARLLWML